MQGLDAEMAEKLQGEGFGVRPGPETHHQKMPCLWHFPFLKFMTPG
jgi:hypothetical protein